jgi:hypothetical protein
VLKPGGLLYVTIHDQATWDRMEMAGFHPWLTSTAEYQRTKLIHPKLEGRVQFTSSRIAGDVRVCNVFHSHDYIRSFWSQFFEVEGICPLRHDNQAGVILRAPLAQAP